MVRAHLRVTDQLSDIRKRLAREFSDRVILKSEFDDACAHISALEEITDRIKAKYENTKQTNFEKGEKESEQT